MYTTFNKSVKNHLLDHAVFAYSVLQVNVSYVVTLGMKLKWSAEMQKKCQVTIKWITMTQLI